MPMSNTVTLPYTPRPPQPEIHAALEAHRFCVLVAHRRMGKTVCVINHLIKQALLGGKPDGFYAYAAPYRNQAKNIAWGYLKHFTEPLPMRQVNEGELSLSLPGGAVIRIFGADNPHSLRGLYFDGVILDEVAQMKPEVWHEIIRPALSDRRGFAVFIGTPYGVNLFSELYYRAVSGAEGWFGAMYRADRTGVLDSDELAALRQEMGEAAYRREYLCDFNAAVDDILISLEVVEKAAGRTHHPSAVAFAPVALGVDVARFGDDASVIALRQGLMSAKPIVLRGLDNMELADRVAWEIKRHKPDGVFIDAGRGEGVIDRLRRLGFAVSEVNFGAKAGQPDKYVNKRAEMWARMAQWLKEGGAVHNDLALKSELSSPTYFFDSSGRLGLEPKDKIKERLGKSPDIADALALTFAYPLSVGESAPVGADNEAQRLPDYNPLEY
jgi:hypothetical protein